MSFIIRPAAFADIVFLAPVMTRDELGAVGRQLVRSATFALVGDQGKAFAAGGIWTQADPGERECWMYAAKRPPARDLVVGVRLILDHAGPGLPLAAYIDGREARHVRFAEVLGFVAKPLSAAHPRAPNLPAHILRMERGA